MGVYVAVDIYAATAALMIAVAIQVGLLWFTKQPISLELKATFWIGLVMGSLTLFFRDEQFIQWKTTIVNTALACALIVTHFKGRAYGTEVVLKKMMESSGVILTDQREAWRTINLGWILSFLFAAGLNLIVAYNFSLDFWVTYKLVGGMLISFTSVALTMIYMYRKNMISEPKETVIDSGQDTP